MASKKAMRRDIEDTRPDVARAWNEIGYEYPRTVRKLLDSLGPEESVLMMCPGEDASDSGGSDSSIRALGLAVATNLRVLLFFTGITKQWMVDFPYDRITTVTTTRGILYTNLHITASGPTTSMGKMNKSRADRFALLIEERVEAARRKGARPAATPGRQETSLAAGSSVAAELRELAELRDSGILTDREFEEQKRRLLGS